MRASFIGRPVALRRWPARRTGSAERSQPQNVVALAGIHAWIPVTTPLAEPLDATPTPRVDANDSRPPGAEPVIERARELALVEGGSMKDIVRQATAELERDLIARALDETGGNVTHAARRLKISRKSLQIKMKELGLREVRDDSDEGRDVDDEPEGGVGGGVS